MTKERSTVSKESLFHEIKAIDRGWILFILIVEIFFFAGILFRQMIMGIPFGPLPITNTGLIIIALLFIIPLSSLLLLRLYIQVSWSGIYYYMKPFGGKKHHIKTDTIKKYYIRPPDPSKKKPQKVKGVYIILNTGKLIFLPSRNPSLLINAIHLMMKEK